MERLSMRKFFQSSGLCLSAVLLAAGCKVTEPTPFSPQLLQQSERSHSSEVVTQNMRPLPTTLESPFPGRDGKSPSSQPTTGPSTIPAQTRRMTLQEIVHRAVANNYDVRVAGYNTAIDETRVVEAEAAFDPVFFANGQHERRDNVVPGTVYAPPGSSTPVFTNVDQASITSAAAGIRQNLTSGGQIQVQYQTAYNHLNPPRYSINNYWENNLVLELTQPLLRDFGSTVNKARITVSRQNQRISLLDFRLALVKNIAEIEQTYWQLSAAERDVRIQEELLKRTEDTAIILDKRRRQDVTRLQVSQADAAVQSRRAALVRAKARIRDLSDQLKQLMNDADFPITSALVILPADAPAESPIHFDLQDQIETAMENRAELGQQQLRVDTASVVVQVAKNNLLPQLNLVGSVGAQGLGGNFDNAVDVQSDFDHIGYRIGLQLEIPIGNRAARAAYRRSWLQRQQAIDTYASLVSKVALEVKQAQREVQTSWDEMVATRQARFAQADALLALQQREDNGEALTPTFVQLKLDTQANLANAQRAESTALTNYNLSIVNLERTKGTLLRYNNILMDEATPQYATRQVER
jgi:outer membrane protein TolC